VISGVPLIAIEEKSRLLDESDGFRLLLQRQKAWTNMDNSKSAFRKFIILASARQTGLFIMRLENFAAIPFLL